MGKFYQQGDVLLEIISDLDGKEIQIPDGKIVEGEATGHSHTFDIPQNVKYFRNEKQELFLDVLLPTTLRHQEHKGIEIPIGKYKIKIVHEYNHFLEETKEVQD